MSITAIETPSPEQALKQYFGLKGFRTIQKPVIEAILQKKNVLVIMPTGGGKSICYQLPAMMLEGVTVVISPLISLMQDQVDTLQAKNIPATFINSSLSTQEQQLRLQQLAQGEYKIVYVAPERFRQKSFMAILKLLKISFFAIDEAHCISQWGHDFRPDYMQLGAIIKELGNPPVGAFTATATPDVRTDICANLNLTDYESFVSGFARSNLEFRIKHVKKKASKYKHLSHLIEEHKQGIVYCSTRKQVDEVAVLLQEWDISHVCYHAGMNDAQRAGAQESFMKGSVDVAVATNAFGMGIDRSDLRFVLHFQVPGSIEAYYQEAGRAGRDGKNSVCELLFSFQDKFVQEFFIEGSNPSQKLIRNVYDVLKQDASNTHEVYLSIDEITAQLSGKKNSMAVGASLSFLNRAGYVERFDIPGKRIRGTRLLRPHIEAADLDIDDKLLREKEQRDRTKIETMVRYAYSNSCRQKWILDYFGDKDSEPCGKCDACTNKSKGAANKRSHLSSGDKSSGLVRIPTDDELLIVQKALSGVARMSTRLSDEEWGGRFGRHRIIEMLLGSRSAGVLKADLDSLSTYGILKDFNKNYLLTLFDGLEEAKLLQKDHQNGFELTTLSVQGTLAMKGQMRYKMVWPQLKRKATKAAGSAKANKEIDDGLDVDEALFEKLRTKRLEIARRREVPAYVVLHNDSLRHFAALKPLTEEDAIEIPGIGSAKLKSVVPEFLEVIKSYC